MMADDHAAAPPDTQVVSEVLVDSSDQDSSYGEEDRSSISTSINSTVTTYRTVHGRRYHAFEENQYWLPNDDTEIGRLSIQHHCWRLSLGGKLCLAPIMPDIHNAVDIGTGTGEWAMEFAEQYPSAKVIGTDLSPVQDPKTPSNCSWLVDNAEQEWVYDVKFDYVHSRMLLLGIHDWDRYFQQSYDNLKPGGWCEAQEPLFPTAYIADGGVTSESAYKRWGDHIVEAAAMDNIDMSIAPRLAEYIQRAGFVNIVQQEVIWPIGIWAKGEREKALGYWSYEDTRLFLGGTKLLFTKRLGWDIERVEQLIKEAEADIDRKESHYYWRL
jgi:ubiquinone/menaquinone biosynthesis C-methylase UbiE